MNKAELKITNLIYDQDLIHHMTQKQIPQLQSDALLSESLVEVIYYVHS